MFVPALIPLKDYAKWEGCRVVYNEGIISKTVLDQSIDLLIMGAYSHSPVRSLLFGSKTTDILHSSTIPTLLLG